MSIHCWSDLEAFKKIDKNCDRGWLELRVFPDFDRYLQCYSEDLKELRLMAFGKRVSNSVQTELSYDKGYKIHAKVFPNQISLAWDLLIKYLEEHERVRNEVFEIKMTTRNDVKMNGIGNIVVYSLPNSASAQIVLDAMIEIFEHWNQIGEHLDECYHVVGPVYYSGGNRCQKKHIREYYPLITWDNLFRDKSHILWKNQVPLTMINRTQDELESEIQQSDWYLKKQNYRLEREQQQQHESDDDSSI